MNFIVETKGSNLWDDLRAIKKVQDKMRQKTFCRLATGENPAKYIKARSVDDIMGHG